jgi:tetratricopeptide (TPR) repeat protein
LCVLSVTIGNAGAVTVPALESMTAPQDPESIDPRDLQMLAILYIEDGQPYEAIPLLERSIDLYPENGETYMWLGVAQTFTEQFPLAEESFMKALARNPALTEVRNYLGFLRYKEGDLGAAVHEYLACIADPVYPPVSKSRVRYNLGNVYMEMGDIEAAREQFTAAAATVTARDQLFPPLNIQLAKALKELGRMQEAIAALTKVTEIDEQNVEAHLELGLAYRDLSQAPAARRHLQTVIDLSPGTDASARAQAALARLQS